MKPVPRLAWRAAAFSRASENKKGLRRSLKPSGFVKLN
jgi:hypothetical protein